MDAVTNRFQHLYRSFSNMRLVITHERVVPQDHFAFRGAVDGRSMFREPSIEPFTRIMRQGSFGREPEHALQNQPQRAELEQCIRDRRHGASEFPQQIDIAQYSLTQRKSVAAKSRMRQSPL